MRNLSVGVRSHIEEIRELLHGRNRNTVLPIIGAGLSSPYLPGWKQLLHELIGQSSPEHRDALESALEAGRFLDLAATLEVDSKVQRTGISAAITSSILLKLNREAEALADLDHAIRLAPKFVDPHRMKAAVLADRGKHLEAIAAATAALAAGGDDALMLQIRAECLLALKRYGEAAADVERARKLESPSASLEALTGRLAALMRKG
jgi:tetratricopeptide (TPR) repeat protein